MTNTDIAKIRQLLKIIRGDLELAEWGHYDSKSIVHLDEVLALLPCETCGDTRRILGPDSAFYAIGSQQAYMPCPDCQP